MRDGEHPVKQRCSAACLCGFRKSTGTEREQAMQETKKERETAAEEKKQTDELLTWYAENRRILPWREDPTPYHVWLSEIMLQQTRVEAGKAYYLRFLESLPDIASLAAASEEVYLKLWEGLGYYSRVRNLHKAAVMIMEEYGGKMPDSPEKLEKLPGIGPYSAAAIASIAFQKPAVSVDGNLLRVFARMMEYGEDIKAPAARKAALAYYGAGISKAKRPGDFNQALMDLGAGICLPNGEPLCLLCPWKERCLAHRDGRETAYPEVPPKKERKKEKLTVFLIRSGDFLAVRRRGEEGLLAGLWEFPNVPGWLKEEEAEGVLAKMGLWKEDSGCPGELAEFSPGPKSRIETEILRKLPTAKHIFSHIEWHMTGYEAQVPPFSEKEREKLRRSGIFLVTRKELMETYSIPSAFEKYKKIALEEA